MNPTAFDRNKKWILRDLVGVTIYVKSYARHQDGNPKLRNQIQMPTTPSYGTLYVIINEAVVT